MASIFEKLKKGAENYNAQMRKKKVSQNQKASYMKVSKTQASSAVKNVDKKGKALPSDKVGPNFKSAPAKKKTTAKANYGTVNPKTTGMKSEKTAPSYSTKKNYGTVNPKTTGMKSEKIAPNYKSASKPKGAGQGIAPKKKKQDKRAMGRALQNKAVRSMGIR